MNDVLTLDFDDSDDPRSNPYAFLASDEELEAVLQRVKDEGMAFGSGPGSRTDWEINRAGKGRGIYVECKNGYFLGGDYVYVCDGLRWGWGGLENGVLCGFWVPAFAGMTGWFSRECDGSSGG